MKQIPLPSWKGVRNIYKKLSDEFQVLTSTYNIGIDAQTKLHLDHLIIAIDEIDNCIDDLSLLVSIPRKIQFTKYCFRFAFALMKG